MLENLKLSKRYDGFLYLAEAKRNPPKLKSHHHVELELNLVVRGPSHMWWDGAAICFKRRVGMVFPVARTPDGGPYR
jgi:hypothetical protein